MTKDKVLTSEVCKSPRIQRCEACEQVKEQNEIRPVYLANKFRTMHVCRDCEKSLN